MYPQLLHFGRFFLPTYGFLVALGVLIGLWISVRNSERLGIDGEKAWNLGILVVLCGIVGAKVLYIINDWGTYSAHPSEIFSIETLQAGGVFSGGLIAAFIAAAWYVRKHHMPALGTCDAFAPGLALGHAIGRIGCFAAGCCYGKETHHWWSVTFTNPLAAAITGTPLNKPLEPTQLFESAVELANFFFRGPNIWLIPVYLWSGAVLPGIPARRSGTRVGVWRRDVRHAVDRDWPGDRRRDYLVAEAGLEERNGADSGSDAVDI